MSDPASRPLPSRVLLVSHVAPPHVGGVEQLVRQEAEALLELGAEVHWSTSDGTGGGESPALRPGFTLERLRAWHGIERRFHVAYPIFGPGAALALWRAVGRADLVHVHGLVFVNTALAAVIARLRGRRLLLTDHGGVLRYRSKLATWLLRALIETVGRVTARCAHRLIAYNADVQRLLARLSGRPDRVRFLSNPVDERRFAPPTDEERAAARRALGWDATPRLLFVGRVLPHKGIDLMLSLVEPHLRVVVVGPATAERIAQVRARGADYLPPRGHDEMSALYHAADVLVLPSHNEGFPVVIQEALACGLPVVARAHAAYEPYRDIDGLTLVPADVEAFRAAVAAALQRRASTQLRLQAAPWLSQRRWAEQLLGTASGDGV